MIRETRMVTIKGVPMQIFEAPECISDDIVKYNDFSFIAELSNNDKEMILDDNYIST